MPRRALHNVSIAKPKKYKAEIGSAGDAPENPFKAPAAPYRSPRARARLPRTEPERGRFIKLSVAVGILVALVLIKIFDPQGAAGMRKSVDTYIGGDKSAVTVEALGRAITEGDNILQVFKNLSDVLSGKAQDTPVSNPILPAEEDNAESGEPEEDDIDPNNLHMALVWESPGAWEPTPVSNPEPIMLSEDEVVMGAFGIDDTLPIPFGMDVPENVDFTHYQLPFEYTQPVAGVKSSGFGYRRHPILDEILFHYGTDFGARTGEDILSFADGRVAACGYSKTYGNYIMVTHGDGVSSFYAHCDKLTAKLGDTVKKGQVIAKVGGTGQATGPHLHFELRRFGSILDPEYYTGE